MAELQRMSSNQANDSNLSAADRKNNWKMKYKMKIEHMKLNDKKTIINDHIIPFLKKDVIECTVNERISNTKELID